MAFSAYLVPMYNVCHDRNSFTNLTVRFLLLDPLSLKSIQAMSLAIRDSVEILAAAHGTNLEKGKKTLTPKSKCKHNQAC